MVDEITYRTTDMTRWGVGFGSDLPAATIDISFWSIALRLNSLQDQFDSREFIEDVEVDEFGMLTFITSDYRTLGPVQIPPFKPQFRGAWAPSTQYFINDTFSYGGGTIYVVMLDHTSDLTFDPNANNGLGDNYYDVGLTLPAGVIPSGGSAYMVISKVDSTDYNISWRSIEDLFTGTTVRTIAATVYVPNLADLNCYIRCTADAGCEVTIPPDVFPANAEMHFRQAGGGAITFVAGVGVTINPPRPDYDTITPWEGATATIKHIGANEFDYIGIGTPVVEGESS